MRALWSGGISFGLIYIPVQLYTASRRNTLDFDLLRRKDMSRIGYAKFAKSDGKEVDSDEIVKGFEFRKDEYVIVEDEDFEKANVKKTNSIEIKSFTDIAEIDPRYFEKPYFIEPDPKAHKTYALLHHVLTESKKVAVASYVLRDREHLALVMPEKNHLILEQIRFDEELLEPEELEFPADQSFAKEEIDMAKELVDKMTKPFKPEEYKDTYTEELRSMIKEKALHKKVTAKGEKPKPTQIRDLMKSLKESLKATS
ncbi:MAG: putative DNA repair protein YkoV [candidate division WS6 bacterium OLB20]|uniref:Non-homologous end joining protein Ku n=1 Tax=candidate division WS6 bacterium OLB20 TaxID=1617426 RepID=A0A136LW67_9BACT|nr:MAG: putative DNA repair protein YkoV [candidate division WS6 bacterium OLB20]